jgi:short subunit dehydrogenase-like uncharacterized protein
VAAPAYELVVYGASGYTGREAVAHLAGRAGGLGLRWAIAGRNRAKLEQLAAGLPGPRPGIVIAEAGDSESLAALAASGAALISLVGPHAPLGDELLERCIEAGTDYADLCGENDVIERRVAELHEPAKAAGVKLIPACGYESVPFDLAVLGLDQAFRDEDGSHLAEAEAEVRFIFARSPLHYGHGNSGGTLATVARLVEAGDLGDSARFARAAGSGASASAPSLAAKLNKKGEWLAPLAPTPFLNPAVIALTSARLGEGADGYSSCLRYREALNLSASLGSPLLGRLGAKGSAALLRRVAAMSVGRRSAGDRLALAALTAITPRSGSGPDRSSLDEVDYEIELQARSSTGQKARMLVHGAGHPGYRSAANIIAEAGIALARGEALPDRPGVQTPASGLGWGFAEALASAGLRFELATNGEPSANRRGVVPERS